MASTRSRVFALGVLTLAVALAGVVALGAVCDFDASCGEAVDRSYSLSEEGNESQVLAYAATLEAGAVVADSAHWTTAEAADSLAETHEDGEPFLLSVRKNGVLLEEGARYRLPAANGTIVWHTGQSGTDTTPGDDFRFSLFRGPDPGPALLQTRVEITR